MNQSNNLHLRVIAITVDTHKITLYDEMGDTHTLKQGDPRVPAIIEHAVPLVNAHKVAVVDMTVPRSRHYEDVEKNSSGLVKLFRVTKCKVQELVSPYEDASVDITDGGNQEAKSTPVSDVMKHAIPTSDHRFHEPANPVTASYDKAKEGSEQTTICAVVDGVVIPGVENLERYLQRASNMGSYDGVLNFLRRVAAVIHQRNHSIEDLFRFLERADLPIADDGSIIIYKVLRKHREKANYFADCHTGNVPQRVGSYVMMDASMVDHNRRNECSNGLHVARRGYIRSFSGDVCFMGKLAPEDVIAVPDYDANKMRVCGYHLLFQLSPEMYANLRADKPITDSEAGKTLLGRALAGDHPHRIENIRITEQRGGGIEIEPLNEDGTVQQEPVKVTPSEALPDSVEETAKSETVDFNEINSQKQNTAPTEEEPVTEPKAFSQMTRSEQAVDLWLDFQTAPDSTSRKQAAIALSNFKRSKKVSWEKLGLDKKEVEKKINHLLD